MSEKHAQIFPLRFVPRKTMHFKKRIYCVTLAICRSLYDTSNVELNSDLTS